MADRGTKPLTVEERQHLDVELEADRMEKTFSKDLAYDLAPVKEYAATSSFDEVPLTGYKSPK